MESWSSALNFREIGNTFGTPLYIFSKAQLVKNFHGYLAIVKDPANIAFPVKTNPSLSVLREIFRLGGSVDCAAMNEVKLAKLAGFEAKNIIFNTPSPDIEDVQKLLMQGCYVVIDASELLYQLDEIYCQTPFSGKILLRVNPHVPVEYMQKEEWQDLTAHAAKDSKFGIPSEVLQDVLEQVSIPVMGLHTHLGTQMDNTVNFVNVVRFMNELAATLSTQTHHTISCIDFGGGLGINLTGYQNYPSIQDLQNALQGELDANIRYIVEPGHSLVGKTMGMLSKVVAIKEMRGRKWAIVDVGTDQLNQITLIKWTHQILREDAVPLPFAGDDAVGGPLCFAGDTLLQNTSIETVKPGDFLFIQHCGAYCYAVSSEFNGRLYQGMVKIEEDGTAIRCNEAAPGFLSPTQFTYRWEEDAERYTAPKTLDLELVRRLQSEYLSNGAAKDTYEIVRVDRVSENSFDVQFDVRSSLGVVSMPLAIRLIGDAAIVSLLYLSKKEVKDVSVWGDWLSLQCPQSIDANRIITCTIAMSPISSRKTANDKVATARFSLEGDRFSGVTRLKFTL